MPPATRNATRHCAVALLNLMYEVRIKKTLGCLECWYMKPVERRAGDPRRQVSPAMRQKPSLRAGEQQQSSFNYLPHLYSWLRTSERACGQDAKRSFSKRRTMTTAGRCCLADDSTVGP